jgi:ubiquinone/menaquinone biosynthesis C-methylase UbiE
MRKQRSVTASHKVKSERTYLPAAGHDLALPLYDPIVSLLGLDSARRALLDQARLHSADRVLDVGCGTGSLAILMKQLHPDVHVTGLDPDRRALGRARRKAARSAVSIQLDEGFSEKLSYSDASFDHVFSSFMFHHLAADQREKMLCEIRRVLKPVGSFHMVDFAGRSERGHGWLMRLFHSSERLRDNSESRVVTLMSKAGFLDAKKTMERARFFGSLRIAYFQASAPALRAATQTI